MQHPPPPGGVVRSTRLGRWPARLWVRLVAIAAVPILGMAWSTMSMAANRSQDARRSQRTVQRMMELSELLELGSALTREEVPAKTLLIAGNRGVELPAMRLMAGFDPVLRLQEARRGTDRMLASSHSDVVIAIRQEIGQVRARADSRFANSASVSAGYDELQGRLLAASESQINGIASLSPGIGAAESSADDIARAVRSLSALLDASRALSQQYAPLLELVQPAAKSVAGDRDTAPRELIISIALEAEAKHRLAPELTALAAQELDVVAVGGDARQFRVLSEAVASGVLAEEPVDLATASASFRGGLDLLSGYQRAIELVVSNGSSAAASARHDAQQALQRSVALASLLAAASLALVLLLARSISRPLQSLARRAEQMVDGDAVQAPLVVGGPVELVVVEQALNEAMINLGSIQEQAHALANGDLENPVLQTPASGALGRSIQVTFDRLSQSIREREELQNRLAHQANHDALTLLPNRTAALLSLDRMLARSQRTGDLVALLFVDLDGFKRANDEHGHPFGDKVLRQAAQRLLGAVRVGDEVARLGGDEFVVIAEKVIDAGEAMTTANRLINDLSMTMEIDGKQVRVGASVGIALSRGAEHDADEMLRQADLAVYRAKARGRGRCELFDEELRKAVTEAADIERSLRTALEFGEFSLQYQPVVDTTTGTLSGIEAMLRWDREGPALAPSVFLPVAEASQIILDIDRWVLDRSLAQLADWSLTPGLENVEMSVNISGRSILRPTIVRDVRAALEQHKIAAERVVVEISETMLLGDLSTASEHLDALRQLGVRVAIDDFGTGYMAIGQLGRLPLDLLKIDRSLVEHVGRPQERAIVELVVELGHTLGLGLVAKGVETDEQHRMLTALGCDGLQGFWFSPPLAPADLEQWVLDGVAVRN